MLRATVGAPFAGSGTTAARPANPLMWAVYFDTSIGQPIWYQGAGVWINAAGVSV